MTENTATSGTVTGVRPKMSTMNCVICDRAIRPGESREPLEIGVEHKTVHSDCIHESPLPHFRDTEIGDEMVAESDDWWLKGKVVGKGPCADPVEGEYLFVEAEVFDGLPRDRIMVIHRKKRGSWTSVYVFVDQSELDEETGEWTDEWRNYGKVSELELHDDE